MYRNCQCSNLKSYFILDDVEESEQQTIFDGFYTVSDNLDMDDKITAEITDIKKGRWNRESFMLLMFEFKSRTSISARERAHFCSLYHPLYYLGGVQGLGASDKRTEK